MRSAYKRAAQTFAHRRYMKSGVRHPCRRLPITFVSKQHLGAGAIVCYQFLKASIKNMSDCLESMLATLIWAKGQKKTKLFKGYLSWRLRPGFFSAFWRQCRGVNFPVNWVFKEICLSFLENFLEFLEISWVFEEKILSFEWFFGLTTLFWWKWEGNFLS